MAKEDGVEGAAEGRRRLNPPEDGARAQTRDEGARRSRAPARAKAPPSASAPDATAEGPALVGPLTPVPARPRKSDAVRLKLLDTAEMLFAKFGYAGVSIRDVTAHAKMRLANVSYYFGSKQNLYFEVLRRRSEPLARERTRRFEAVIESNLKGEARLAALVDAYVDPAIEFRMSDDPGWRHYFSLIGQVTFSRLYPQEVTRYYNTPARKLMQALQELYPDATPKMVQAAAILMIGPYIYVLAETGRIETFPEAAFTSGDFQFLGPAMKQFLLAGVRSLLSGEARDAAPARSATRKSRTPPRKTR